MTPPNNTLPTDALKPCPFCDGPAKELIHMQPMWSRQVYGCQRCNVSRNTVEAWNTRATDPQHKEEAERERDQLLVELYRIAPVATAKRCDEQIDRSGALLGRIRELARKP